MYVLDNPVRGYAWGSKTRLAEFLGRAPTGRHEAELWIGAHEADPSALTDGRRLDDVIAAESDALLGPRVRERLGDRLPFLMKVLAVEEPLSLQVHPSAEQARLGFAREDAAGISLTAPDRNYQDRSHKPELLFALTRFEGMAGFRDVERSAAILRQLHVPWARDTATRLLDGPPHEALRTVVTDTLALEGRPLARLLTELGDAARHAEARARRTAIRDRARHAGADAETARVFARLGDLVRRYPRDPGALVTLLLNNVLLTPGEALFVNAGVVHAYVEGLGVEIMASSDNVVRAGLTPKHRDVEELLAITSFTPVPAPRWHPAERSEDRLLLRPPVSEFDLTVGRPPLRRLPATGPRAVLVLEGEVEVVIDTERLSLRRGQSVFVGHADGPLAVAGDGRVAVGAVPL